GSYIQLAATEKGYGTVWIGAFDSEKLKIFVNAPDYLEPVAIIPIGIPAEQGRKKERRPVSDFIHYEKF
ncbi:MAG: nitroreductase family protein, partial [Candidatus Micrarchaeota archaeon]|nr:nitroreductase family protein [Candidatus Micrarchaeota archaeon]